MAAFSIGDRFLFSSLILTLSLLQNCPTCLAQGNHAYDLIELTPNQQHAPKTTAFAIYCSRGASKSILSIWRNAHLELLRAPSKYQIFSGENETVVYEKYRKSSFFSTESWFYEQNTVMELPAFSNYCVGIDTASTDYAFFFRVRSINYWKLLQMTLGVLLYLSSPSLSRNSFFHYTSGVSLGVLASVLIAVFLLSRLMPRKNLGYAVLVCGFSFVAYLLRGIWQDLHSLVATYADYFLLYCFVTATISFVVCYRFGPVRNPRTFDLIQWSMQAVALLLVFFSSEYRELSTGIIIILLTWQLIPGRWVCWARQRWYRFFPPKVKLLSESEYFEQGQVETRRSLEELRSFCGSPECNAWKTIKLLKDPKRFADFIEKGQHFTDQEMLDYNAEDLGGEEEDKDSFESHNGTLL